MDPITVDGDLSDWPENSTRYPIRLSEYGARPTGVEDFQAFFRVGYNLDDDSLYLAVEVSDESTVIDEKAPNSWNTQDGCEVYLDLAHEEESPATQHVVRGLHAEFDSTASIKVERAVNREGSDHHYEWRLSLAAIDRDSLLSRSGLTVGFDVVVCDQDSDGSFSWVSWGKGGTKWLNVPGRGDLILMPSAKAIGVVKGRVRWERSGRGVAATIVRVESIASPRVTVRIETDRQGSYSASFPEGRCRVVPEVGRGSIEPRVVWVKRLEATEIDFTVPPAHGQRIRAGTGRFVQSASGIPHQTKGSLQLPDGLVRGRVRAILQDRQGALWLATAGGAGRYDGMHFTNFTTDDGLPSNDVRALFNDRHGAMWIGTAGGLTRFADSQFTTFVFKDGLAGNHVSAIGGDREGRLWVGTRRGVSCFDGAEFTTFTTADGLASNRVTAIATDGAGSLWFGSDSSGISRFDGKEFATFSCDDGLPDHYVASIGVDREGVVWVGTSRGVSRYEAGRFRSFTKHHGFPQLAVQGIVTDRNGVLWLVNGPSVMRYDGSKFSVFDTPGAGAIRTIAVDRQTGLWVVTQSNHVIRYGGPEATVFKVDDGLADNLVHAIFEDSAGAVWFGTGRGVSRFDGSMSAPFSPESHLSQ